MSPSAGLPPALQGVPLVFAAAYLQNGAHLFDFNAVGAVRKRKAESCKYCEPRYSPQGLPS